MGIGQRALVTAGLTALLALSACQQSSSGAGKLPQDGTDGTGGTSAGGTGTFTQASDPSAGIQALSDSLDNYPAEDSQQQAALDDVQDALESLSGAWQGVRPGAPISEILEYFDRLARDRDAIIAAAIAARNARMHALYLALMRLMKRSPVFRFYHPRKAKHFQTLSRNEVSALQGWKYDGVSFFVWHDDASQEITQIPTGREVRWWRCLAGALDHFISVDARCEGKKVEGLYGKVSAVQTAFSPMEAVRLYRKNGSHLTTLRNPQNPGDPRSEVNTARAHGYRPEGGQGFPPL